MGMILHAIVEVYLAECGIGRPLWESVSTWSLGKDYGLDGALHRHNEQLDRELRERCARWPRTEGYSFFLDPEVSSARYAVEESGNSFGHQCFPSADVRKLLIRTAGSVGTAWTRALAATIASLQESWGSENVRVLFYRT